MRANTGAARDRRAARASEDPSGRTLRDVEHFNAHQGDASERIKRIRNLLDMATGQLPAKAKLYLREIAVTIREGAAPPL